MSNPEERNSDRAGQDGQDPTASFDSSRIGPGSRIGRFRVEQEVGRGGAGVVFLARDTRLDREVAIKSLPVDLAENPKVRSRFSREARALASLSHPNIATIYEELEEAEGMTFLVLEYVPGQTLADQLAKGPLKLDEALSISVQIAEALAAAHEHDVIHRDLKPGNIKITPEGKVKVLDFGLAKVVEGQVGDQRSTVTEPGRIIGTPAYMSPEQARGKPIDKRCDIWSFGCVLYEMLTGKVPFEGETVSDTLAQILQTEPGWQALPRCTPASIRVMLHRCLEKEPNRRLRDIGDAAIEIRETLSSLATVPTLSTSSEVAARHKPLWQWVVGIAFVVLTLIAVALLTRSPKPTIPGPLFDKYPIELPQNQMLYESWPMIAVSPDGKRLVYKGGVGVNSRLFLREFESNKFVGGELPETQGADILCFSPDSRCIGFEAGGKLKKLFLDGGRPEELCDSHFTLGATWCLEDDTIFFSSLTDGLWKIPANGGPKEQVTRPNEQEGEFGHWWPEILPGGEAVLFTVWNRTLNDLQVAVLLRDTREKRILIPGASHARYAKTGHLLYAQSGTLMAAPFDLKKLKVGEPRRPVIEDLNQQVLSGGGYAPFCLSTDGLLYYARGGDWLARRNIVWVDRHTGDVIEPLLLEPGAYASPRLSPDRQSIAYTKFDSGVENIWVYDLPKELAKKVTFEYYNFCPIWKPGDNELTFTSCTEGRYDVYWKSEGMNGAELLVTGENDRIATSWSPDGKVLLFTENDPNTGKDIWRYFNENGTMEQLPIINTPNHELGAVFSPDGNWIAYISTKEEDSPEVYVASYPEPVVNEKISTGGGNEPVWSAGGDELFYCCGNKMVAVTIETEPELKVGDPNTLFEKQYYTGKRQNYDVSRDGQRFLMVKSIEEEVVQLVVVPNFFEKLKRLVPVRRD